MLKHASDWRRLKCKRCGEEFESYFKSTELCDECRYQVRSEAAKKTLEKKVGGIEYLDDQPQYTLRCSRCGKEFQSFFKYRKMCDDCFVAVRTETIKKAQQTLAETRRRKKAEREEKERLKRERKPLEQWASEALECNMDYATYRYMIDTGCTFEELKSTAHLRRLPTHSHVPSSRKRN